MAERPQEVLPREQGEPIPATVGGTAEMLLPITTAGAAVRVGTLAQAVLVAPIQPLAVMEQEAVAVAVVAGITQP